MLRVRPDRRLSACLLLLAACGGPPTVAAPVAAAAAAASAAEASLPTAGVRRVPVRTAKGDFHVWTRRVGDNPRLKVLLLHGGPGMTHEYLEPLAELLPAAGIEVWQYDQLGSWPSDQPDEPDLWQVPRFVDEVEQVRVALGLDRDDFVLYGHSWGGILAIEYALAHGEHLKALVVSNMMSSAPAYNAYARDVLMPQLDPAALAEIRHLEAEGRTAEPRYMELLMPQHYERHILRRPAAEWPDGVLRSLEHVNAFIYVALQGPSELGMSGLLEGWDRSADLGRIAVPTLVIGATHDTMDPAHMRWMAGAVQHGRYLHCAEGSHLALHDDQATYVQGLLRFLRDVDAGRF